MCVPPPPGRRLLESVVAAGFDPNRGLFSATPDGHAYPNPLAERLDGGLAALETMGLVLGRALYEGVLLDCPLAPFFVSRLQVGALACPLPFLPRAAPQAAVPGLLLAAP